MARWPHRAERHLALARLQAGDGVEGLRVYGKGGIDLVVTDIIMPQKGGIDTIMDLRRDFPAVKIIAISGGGMCGEVSYLDMAIGVGADRAIGKPFVLDDFLAAVEELIAEKRGVALTARSRMSRRSRRSAPRSLAPRMRIASTGIAEALASASSGLPGWQTIRAPQPWLMSQRASATVRISWPPCPTDDSVCRTVCMQTTALRIRAKN